MTIRLYKTTAAHIFFRFSNPKWLINFRMLTLEQNDIDYS